MLLLEKPEGKRQIRKPRYYWVDKDGSWRDTMEWYRLDSSGIG
jgi:hypothetical protein